MQNLVGSQNPAQIAARAILEMRSDSISYIEPLPVWAAVPALRKTKQAKKTTQSTIIKLYPNPTKDYLCVEIPDATVGSLTIVDSKGITIAALPINAVNKGATITTTDWASGVYLYCYAAEGSVIATGKFEIIK